MRVFVKLGPWRSSWFREVSLKVAAQSNTSLSYPSVDGKHHGEVCAIPVHPYDEAVPLAPFLRIPFPALQS